MERDGRRKLNADQKRARRAGDLMTFVQRYARKAYTNDRRCDRDVEARVKRMSPEELDGLLRDDECNTG